MRLDRPTTLFGSRRRTEVLLLVALLGESYPSELARLLDVRPFTIQSIVDDLEAQGVVASRRVGRQRMVALDPRFLAARPLRELLVALANEDPDVLRRAAAKRARPRRGGKPL